MIDFIQLIPSVDAIRIELFRAHRHMARAPLAIVRFYNNRDVVVVHVMLLALHPQVVHLEMHQYWVHFPCQDGMFVLILVEPDL